jgi:hypothetical protein
MANGKWKILAGYLPFAIFHLKHRNRRAEKADTDPDPEKIICMSLCTPFRQKGSFKK